MSFKLRCMNDPSHKRFEVSAHVVELWAVDEDGDFVEVITSLDTTHRPDADDYYTCGVCEGEVEVILSTEDTEDG